MRRGNRFAVLCFTVGLAMAISSSISRSDSFSDALSNGSSYGDFRLRFEQVDQDNNLDDAKALTLRSRLGYSTQAVNGFSATLEVEDVRIVSGVDDYSVGPTGFNPGEFSVIADPESTEIDQGFIQYQTSTTNTKLGRQVLTLDNHRFVGHVGWRQDRQTFDAFNTTLQPTDNLAIRYAYLDQRNTIFAQDGDKDSKDHLLNIAYKTAVGTLVGYAYLLEVDNAAENSLDTIGIRFSGSTAINETTIVYAAEFASQESKNGSSEFDADYMMLEGGIVFSGAAVKLGAEVLGSDDGDFGFATPLATMHKFNGWADMFLMTPAQGLVDVYASVSGKLLGGKWSFVYHDFSADEDSSAVDDLGDEIDFSYARQIGKNYYAGIKYAAYSAGDIKVDTDKLWVWVGVKF